MREGRGRRVKNRVCCSCKTISSKDFVCTCRGQVPRNAIYCLLKNSRESNPTNEQSLEGSLFLFPCNPTLLSKL